jgi:hypothetical protein
VCPGAAEHAVRVLEGHLLRRTAGEHDAALGGQVVPDPSDPVERWVHRRDTSRGCGAPVVVEQVGRRPSSRCSAEQG